MLVILFHLYQNLSIYNHWQNHHKVFDLMYSKIEIRFDIYINSYSGELNFSVTLFSVNKTFLFLLNLLNNFDVSVIIAFAEMIK